MALRDQFVGDIDSIFMRLHEFATEREFRIGDGHGGFVVFRCPVVWDKDAVRKQPLVTVHGVFMGDVRCYIAHRYLPRAPLAGEIIYSPANTPWEVIDCTDAESLYELSLAAYRSQPSKYGAN
jgi:hypothetical protein